jgi:hypothetical protein
MRNVLVAGLLFASSGLVIAVAIMVLVFAPVGASDLNIGDSFTNPPHLKWSAWQKFPDQPDKLVRHLEVRRLFYKISAIQESDGVDPVN